MKIATQPAMLGARRTVHPGRHLIAVANSSEREAIYRFRHEVYAKELRQHPVNKLNSLQDRLDDVNVYLIAKQSEQVVGFISITPPGPAGYSIDKYVPRAVLPFAIDDRVYEIRLLTVLKAHRGREMAFLLMYAAFRWVEAHGGNRIVAIGRREVVDMYLRAGLSPIGHSIQSGDVTYDLLQATVDKLRDRTKEFGGWLERLEGKTDWQLNFPFRRPASCFHGGAFFDAVGPGFEALERSRTIVNADVLDAWFPPSPKAVTALQNYLPWLLRTSPPTGCEGLSAAIAFARGIRQDNVLPGAGSSDLIFRALRHWLKPSSHALILDPTYGEYAHVLERVIGCTVDRLPLERRNHYDVDLARLEAALGDGYDLVVLVNPNSPTGRHIARDRLTRALRCAPANTRIWIDETYVDYAGSGQSLEQFAARSENVVVCKSMSKVYALSGARVAYLCGGPHQLEELRAITPPWVVSLPAQVAAVEALRDPEYYVARYAETAILREQLADQLRTLNFEVVPGVANFLLCHLPPNGPDAASVVSYCRQQGVFLRDAGPMGSQLGSHALRLAVKDYEGNRRILEMLTEMTERPKIELIKPPMDTNKHESGTVVEHVVQCSLLQNNSC
jgi:histidinol-phosphate/aromatic aminotransferase/cobyric acid decarboxylase-like protein